MYYLYHKENFHPLTRPQLLEVRKKMERRSFVWEEVKMDSKEVRVFSERQYRMLKGWDLEDSRDLDEVKEFYLKVRRLTTSFRGNLSYYGEVLDEERKIVKNDVLGGEIGLILLAVELKAIHKREGDDKQGWFISSDEEGKTGNWNYFISLKKAIENYKMKFRYVDDESEIELENLVDKIRKRFKVVRRFEGWEKEIKTNV